MEIFRIPLALRAYVTAAFFHATVKIKRKRKRKNKTVSLSRSFKCISSPVLRRAGQRGCNEALSSATTVSRGAVEVLKASASTLLHYLSGLLSFCWVIYELQTGGPAREKRGRLTEEVRGGGGREAGRLKVRRGNRRRKGQEMRTR